MGGKKMRKLDGQNMKIGKKVINVGLIMGVLVIVILLLTYGFNGTTDEKDISVAKLFDEQEGMVVQGTLETKEVNINSKVPGRVIKCYVVEGQEVKEGESLIEISSEELQAKKQQATAAVTQAKAALKASKELLEQAKAGVTASEGLVAQAKAGVTAYEGKVREAKVGVTAAQKEAEAMTAIKNQINKGSRAQMVQQAQIVCDLLQKSYERVATLVEKGAVAQQQLDEIKMELDLAKQMLSITKEGATADEKAAVVSVAQMAQAGVEAARIRVDQAEAALSAAQAQLTQAMAGVKSSQALLYQAQAGVEAKEGLVAQANGALAEVNAYLSEVIIKAPIDGRITSLSPEVGELVSTGTQIAVISNLEETWAQVNIKETQLDNVIEGQEVAVRVPAYPEKVFKGKVTTINAQPDFAVKRATNDNGDFDIVTYGVKVQLENHEELLKPGMSAYIQFK